MTGKSIRIHDRLRAVIEATPGLTQRGLAECMGLNPAAVNRMLYGRRNIMAEEIPIIENYIGQKLDIHTPRIPLGVKDGARRGLSDVAHAPGLLPPFAPAAGSFAVFVFSDDMAPRYFKGELIQINPSLPPEEGRDCLIEKKDGTVLIRRLLRLQEAKIKVGQFSPVAEKEILRKDIKAIYPVIARS